ncbi:MAG: FKBP-type peptidyl-prolyl cis-trans isomerase [Burkholderiaceae bacterium]|nr:FKBP-type peptidyl-prolyl cis-trans isomerase [Burkholderiaceae bacterium]
MEITRQCVVGLTWTLKDTLGEVLDVLDAPVQFMVGGNDLFEAIEDALQGHAPGAVVQVHLEPEQAFGDFDEQRIFLEPRTAFPGEIEEGMVFDGAALPQGVSAAIPREGFYTVSTLYPQHVVLDGNHPLAGIALRLEMKIASVREATEAEIGRGSAGAGFFTVLPTAPDSGALH